MKTLPYDFDQLEISIIETLNNKVDYFHDNKVTGDFEWTQGLKKVLGGLGEEKGYVVCASGFKSWLEAEWLYDMTWYKEEGKGEEARLIEVPLVVESEWNLDFKHIKYDFEKLLVANAIHRLMICQAKKDRFDFLWKYFEDAVAKYPHLKKDDRFLIAILDHEEEVFSCKVMLKQ